MSSNVLSTMAGALGRCLELWPVPGLVLSVVNRDGVVFESAVGFRDVKLQAPATVNTIFPISSCTKPFAATTVGILVDEGRLGWHTPMADLLAAWNMHDPIVQREASLSDLLCHRTGLPAHDYHWYNNTHRERADFVNSVMTLPLAYGFRRKWAYQNQMYTVASAAVSEVAGERWELFTKRRILTPLGMYRTFFCWKGDGKGDISNGYVQHGSMVRQVAHKDVSVMGGACAMSSAVVDLNKWIAHWLSPMSLVGVASRNQILRAHMTVANQSPIGPLHYGLGWYISTYRDQPLYHHGGMIDGFSSMLSFMPKLGFGVIVLCNLHGSLLPYRLSFAMYDILQGHAATQWLDAEHDALSPYGGRLARSASSERDIGLAALVPVRKVNAESVGEYVNPAYGSIRFGQDHDGGMVDYNGRQSPLTASICGGVGTTFQKNLGCTWLPVYFRSTTASRELCIPLEPQLPPISFTRL